MSSDAARHAQLEAKLDSLASLRQEVQRLYESTRAELYAVREEVTRERRARVALGAENARLQEWNRELSAQLSSLLGDLGAAAGAAASPHAPPLLRESPPLEPSPAAPASEPAAGDGFEPARAEQRLRLELASVAVERAKLEAALQQARRGAEEAEERCGALARSGEEMLRDLAEAGARVAQLERHIASQAEAEAQLREARRQQAALVADLEAAEARAAEAQRLAERAGREAEQARGEAGRARRAEGQAERRAEAASAEAQRRLAGARRVVRRSAETAAELALAARCLSADGDALQRENVLLRLLAQRLGATEAELLRPARAKGAVPRSPAAPRPACAAPRAAAAARPTGCEAFPALHLLQRRIRARTRGRAGGGGGGGRAGAAVATLNGDASEYSCDDEPIQLR